MKPKKLPLLDNPDDVGQLLKALNSYGKNSKRDSDVGEAIRAGRESSVDFMTRFYQSPYYKNIVGGREMMYSDQGFEDSAEGERLRNIEFIPNPKTYGKFLGLHNPVGIKGVRDRIGTLADLRNPSGTIEINTEGDEAMYNPYIYTHEMSHASGSPSQDAFLYEGDLILSTNKYDRHMLEGNPSRPYLNKFGAFSTREPIHIKEGESLDEALERERIKVEEEYKERPSRFREATSNPGIPIKDNFSGFGSIRLDYLASRKNESVKGQLRDYLKYLQNPTELAARMRAVTHRLQNEGLMDQDDFDLTYDKLLRAHKNGDFQALQLLQAMGVVDVRPQEGGTYKDFSGMKAGRYGEETVDDVARKNYNKYFRGKI